MRPLRILILLVLTACAREKPRPNILLLTLDTTRADHLGCYGGPATTPTIDALAAAGVRFDQADTVAPLTLPSHATILSGILPLHHGVRNNGAGPFPAATQTLATMFAHNNWRVWLGGGKAKYRGVNIGMHGRVAGKVELQGFYTLSKAEGNILCGADEFRLTCQNQPSYRALAGDVSMNPLDPWCDACFGPLNTDSRHRVTMSAVYAAPFGINVSGIGRYSSALPYSLLSGSDLNGDIFRQDLKPGVSHVNSARGASFTQVDLRVSREFRLAGGFGVELIGEMFNVLNNKNPQKFQSNGTPAAYAGTEPTVGEQRLAQLGARLRF